MSPALQLVLYCILIALASLSGGWIPMVVRITHTRMQVAISLVAGVMLGVGLLHMIPHSFYELGKMDITMWWVIIGFLVMFFLQRFFHFHHHDAPDDGEAGAHEHCDHDHHHHDHGHHHGHAHDHADPSAHAFSWSGAFIGLALHSAVDGLALAAAVSVESHDGVVPFLAGLGTFLAIFLHKPFDSLSIGTLMAAGGWSPRARHIVNVAYALVLPMGVLLFMFGADQESHNYEALLGRALGFAGGAFLCIATSDLLPELQFHSHDRLKLSISLIAGVALAWAIGIFETHGHDHHHGPGSKHPATESRSHDHDHGHGHGHDDHDHAAHGHDDQEHTNHKH
jgi:zinc and cadmium transporter